MNYSYLLDTTILIDLYFGSKIKKRLIKNIIKDSKKFTTYLILGEFNRTILGTIRKILNLFLKTESVLNDYENTDEFIQDVIKDMYFF